MPTATYPPRCPHRVATSRTCRWLSLLIVGLLGSTTATVSLNGQEIDCRLVDPASHMQPWPDDEPEVSTLTLPAGALSVKPAKTKLEQTKARRIAAKWRTKLFTARKKQLAAEAPANVNENTEILIVPTPMTAAPSQPVETPPQPINSQPTLAQRTETLTRPIEAPAQTQPMSQPGNCYQAPPLSALSTSIALPIGKLPTNAAVECAAQNPPTSDLRLVGAWGSIEHHWSATCMRHRPLYFEEINAERYGYTVSYALQPVISAARFFATIPALPYKMAVDHPRDCIYTLGHYRPGSCAPRRWNRLPLKLSAAAVETGFIAGMILLIP